MSITKQCKVFSSLRTEHEKVMVERNEFRNGFLTVIVYVYSTV